MYINGKMFVCEGHKVVPISIMQLKMRHIVLECPYITPLEISSNHYLRM